MGFTVEDLLRTEEGRTMKIVCGEQGLNNEIKGGNHNRSTGHCKIY